MSEKERKKLRGLKAQLDGYADDDDKARGISASLSKLVEKDDSAEPDEERTAWEELRDEIDQYEAEHPELVALLNRIATTLSDMGI